MLSIRSNACLQLKATMTSSSSVTTALEGTTMPPQESNHHVEGEFQPPVLKAPHVFKPAPRREGFIGLLQTMVGVSFLVLISSCYYLVIAALSYIILGPLVLGHVVAPTTLAAIWLAQGFAPLVEYHQMPDVLRKSWLFGELVRYFDMQVVMEERLDTSRQYLFAQYPHGILPLASFLSCYYVADVVPGKQIFCCIHSGIFHLPIVRHVVALVGAVPANRENIAAIKKRKANCSVVVGGVSEMFLQNDETLTIKLRKGFIREALLHGYSLCPMFHYGNDRLYSFVGGADLWRRVSERLPFPFFLATGLIGPLLPRRTPIRTAIGAPLDPALVLGFKPGHPVSEPSDEHIHTVYEAFKDQMRQHYYRHRPEWERRDLAFVEAEHPAKPAFAARQEWNGPRGQ